MRNTRVLALIGFISGMAVISTAEAGKRLQEVRMSPTIRSQLLLSYPNSSGIQQNRHTYLGACEAELERIQTAARQAGQTVKVTQPCDARNAITVNAVLSVEGPASSFYKQH